MGEFNITKIFIQVVINILLISLFLAVFYFTYVKNIESTIFKNNIKYLCDDITSTIKLSGPDIYSSIATQINNVKLPDLTKENEKTIAKNNDVLKSAIYANIMFSIVIIILVYTVYYYSDKSFSFKNILTQNFIILFFIGLTEMLYLNYFASEYISVDPNKIKLAVVNKI